ncbi:LacI family DNA-binding transcriptional regulator [Paenibacillus paeoniae]|uniref:LacI family transcriptional regulator n=1 Tax=Paenibacillus paeoniae TaxID=2292705 RepID=A0A371PI32_9BACL|nr:LacI family DNA-binding transcriptional regulator [Paenibacillus paeoniae]REK75871.1 LacI family transcriptional regulator [Paenibacillus paeoniae]
MTKSDSVTIADVAKRAGVAKSTVSRIINDVPGVKPVTRSKVLQAIEELGFRPNMLARSLKTNMKQQIALAIDDIRNPYYPELAWAVEQVAKENGFRLVLINHYGNPTEELSILSRVNEMHIDGIIMLTISYPAALKKYINHSSVPVCLIGHMGDDVNADMVHLSKSEGILAMEHLIRIGCTNIAYAGGPKEIHQGTRYGAYEWSLNASFMKITPANVYIGSDFSIQTGIQAADYFCNLPVLPDGVYAANDMIAIGLIQRLLEKGIRVPEDVAVVGVDDISWSTITKPRVTSVSNLTSETGRIAAELLLKRIKEEQSTPLRRIQLEPRLIVRESTVKIIES